MKHGLAILLAWICFSCLVSEDSIPSGQRYVQLHSFYQNKRYFDLKDTLRQYEGSSSIMLSFYRGIIDNKFNRLNTSIGHLTTFLYQADKGIDTTFIIDAYMTLGDDYAKTFRYTQAAETYATILSIFGRCIDAEHKADVENYFRIFDALKDVPPQRINIREYTKLQPFDGGYLPVRINDLNLGLGPDTGADFSCIIRSLAQKAGMRLLEPAVNVKNVAGQEIQAQIGVASEMGIGNAEIGNVVFLVFDDRDLYIEDADLQIVGVIGFPVFTALKEVTFYRDGGIAFPEKPQRIGARDLCIDGMQPLIAGHYQGHRHAFCLDTGAGQSVLYPPFFRAYEDEIRTHSQFQEERIHGFGGYRMIPAYLMRNAKFVFAGAEFRIDEIPVLTDYTLDHSHYFFGNIGRDIVRQFEAMTLNFESMGIVFE